MFINNEDWRILIVSSNHPALQRLNKTFSLGCCDDSMKTIYIVEGLNDFYFKEVLSHELVHACMYSYNVNLDDHQEEILADLIATYGQEIIFISNSIFNRLQKCRNENKGSPCY